MATLINTTAPQAKKLVITELIPFKNKIKGISFGRIPSELAVDQETSLKTKHFMILEVKVGGKKYPANQSGIKIYGKNEFLIDLNFRKPAYENLDPGKRPVVVRFQVQDNSGLTDIGNLKFKIDVPAKNSIKSNDQILKGSIGDDIVIGGSRSNKILGFRGDDEIKGLKGNDHIDGGAGNDELIGGNGNDTLIGGKGADILSAGKGDDYMVGGKGRNSFLCESGRDIIGDFNPRFDSIKIITESNLKIKNYKKADAIIKYSEGSIVVLGGDADILSNVVETLA